MAEVQIKSETRQDLSIFPSSFDDYIPKDDKVRMVDSIVRSMDSKPLLSTYDGTGARNGNKHQVSPHSFLPSF